MSDNVIRCPNCGAENQIGDHFCSNCGTRLLRSRPAPVAEETPPPVQPQPQPAPQPEPEPQEPPPPSPVLSNRPQFDMPAPVSTTFSQQNPPPAADDDSSWRMSSLGPPPPRRRRIWLWIVVGLIAACLIVCIATAIFLNTDTGQHWLNDIGTSVAKEATKQAGN